MPPDPRYQLVVTKPEDDVAAITFPGYVSESSVERLYTGHTTEKALCFDLSRAIYFEVSGLLRLLSLIAERQSQSQRTTIRLPKDAPARHILRLWRFPYAVSVVTRTPFRLLVAPEDWDRFGEEWPALRVREDATSARASVLAYLVERRFFGLQTYSDRGRPGLRDLVEEQTTHWSGYALSNLLETVLPAPATDFVRVVVRELLTSTMAVAAAQTVIVGSQLDLVEHTETGAAPGLVIGMWHDGRSVIRELAASAEGQVQGADVSSFAALCRTAIDTFGGSVHVRGARELVSIERTRDRLRAVRSAARLAPMTGDIVMVRLPVRDG